MAEAIGGFAASDARRLEAEKIPGLKKFAPKRDLEIEAMKEIAKKPGRAGPPATRGGRPEQTLSARQGNTHFSQSAGAARSEI